MRKPTTANQHSAIQQSSSVHYFAIAVMILTACSIAISGCSKFRPSESLAFKPMPQPKSLTQRQQRSVDDALAKQDAARLAAQEKATELAEIALEAEAANAYAESVIAPTEAEGDLESQQQDIVAEAAQRAEFEEAMSQVAQVSYEVDVEESEYEAIGDAPTSAIEQLTDSVRLIANADDFEGVPVNVARTEIDFSQANFLRPRSDESQQDDTQLQDDSNTPATDIAVAAPTRFGNAESLQLPLQPMLFNPETRSTKSIYEGTLRPLTAVKPDFESETSVAKAVNESPTVDSFLDPSRAFGTLAPLPLRTQASNIGIESPFSNLPVANTSNSRLLGPIERTSNIDDPRPRVESMAAKASTDIVVAEPVAESAEIFVVDPTEDPTEPQPQVAEMQVQSMPAEQDFPGQPVVDESLSKTSASYLYPTKQAFEVQNEETFVPAGVLDDADAVANAMEQELTATAIPSESPAVKNNDFKVQAVSNTSVTSLCRGCGSESCNGCDLDHVDRGEPMFANNDFAAPAVPGGSFVAPMAIPPAEVPMAQPEQIIPASSEFGSPISLDAPPESDAAIEHVAALPIVRRNTNQPVAASNVPPVGISTLMELNAVTWKSRLDEAIELADERLNRMKTPTDSERVNLRLLKALRGQMEQVENAPGDVQYSENESQYWQHQLEAITAMLQTPEGDNQAVTDYHRHQSAHETLEHLRSAVAQLESIASLKVTSGQFCTEVSGFGQFRTFPSNVFSPGQKMLIYCEVENYKTVEHQSATGGDFRTRLRGSFAIYDANGKVAQQAEFPSVDDVARKRRRDFYMYLPVTLADLPKGQYVLHALVEDIYGNKTASLDPPLEFSVE